MSTVAVAVLLLVASTPPTGSTVVVLAVLAYGLVRYGLSAPAAWWMASLSARSSAE